MGIGSGKLRNDVWIGQLTSGLQGSWRVDDRYFLDGSSLNPELMRSDMRWREVTSGRVAPATWPTGSKYSLPLTNDEWIACQDSIKDRLDYTLILPDPSVCNDPPQFCYEMDGPGCHPQAMWKKDNMWSPRRGLGAASANGKVFVVGGHAREYARIDDSRLIGGLAGQKRIETVKEHSTIREDLVLKNDVWSSGDEGTTWQLVNPGCKDPQEDVLMQTEVWSRNHSNQSLPKFVGSMGSKCVTSSDCYGVAECKALGNTPHRVCVCPMFSPRTNHAVTVQHRFSVAEDGSIFSEDVIYVIGGFVSVKQAFCANRSCGPADGYRLAIDDAWMSTDGVKWVQIKPAFSKNSSFRGRGSHTAMVVSGSSNATYDKLLIFGGETSHPGETSTLYLNDIWKVDLPKEPCCIPAKGCADILKVQNNKCLPSQSDWSIVTPSAEWSERSGHVTVYEPRSSRNTFHDRVFLSGGKNAGSVLSDVWTWSLLDGAGWHCDFCSDADPKSATSARDVFLSVDSPLAEIKRFQLPPLDADGNLVNLTSRSAFPIVSDKDISIMVSEGVNTIIDLASADLYRVAKLRGFDYPGRHAPEVPNICFLRALSIAIVDKCTIKASPTSSFFHKTDVHRTGQPLSELPSTLCGRGGESKPCVRGDWDGCTPIPGATKVDVHGVGYVAVPQITHDPSSVLEEIFCRQVPGGRYSGAAEFLDNKVVLLGGIGYNSSHLYRDVWSRDETFPQAFIATRPPSGSSLSQFYFDSNEVGVHVFEYKLMRDGLDIIPWTTTTKSLGANVAWLDDKIGGPGRGWYTLYVRAVDPSGNRDIVFSTLANVYSWYYIPSIPWGVVSGCTVATLALISSAFYEYRRRKRIHIMQKFQLRRLRRKFKLRGSTAHDLLSNAEGESLQLGRKNEAKSSRSQNSSRALRRGDNRSRDDGTNGPRSQGDRSHSLPQTSHSGVSSKSSESRSKSHRSQSRSESSRSGVRKRRSRKKITADERDEARTRRRRDREIARRDLGHQ